MVLALVIPALAFPVYLRLGHATTGSDIPAHARLVSEVMATNHPFSYSAWYPLISLVTGGSADHDSILTASIATLTVVTTTKVLLCYFAALHLTGSPAGATAVAILTFAAMPVLNPLAPRDIYLGQIAPNVWHNSTLIFALPLALVAFLSGVAFYRRLTWTSGAIHGLLLFLSTAAKPNYTLALGLVLGGLVIVQLVRSRRGPVESAGLLAVAFLPSVALLAYQYFATYALGSAVKTTLVFAPFETWRLFSENIPLSLLLSLLGPAVTLAALSRERRRGPLVVISWSALAIALVQLSLFGELTPEGDLSGHGNHFWGAYAAIFIVFFVSGVALVREARDLSALRGASDNPTSVTSRMLKIHASAICMALHLATGLYYMSRIGSGDFSAF